MSKRTTSISAAVSHAALPDKLSPDESELPQVPKSKDCFQFRSRRAIEDI